MSVIAWIILGLAAGIAARLVQPGGGQARGGWLAGVVVGVLGALLGGFLAAVLLGLDVSGLDPTSLLVAGLGALSLILLVRAMPDADVFQ